MNPDQLDMNHFCEAVSTDELKVYSTIVFSKAFERRINLAVAIFHKNGKEIARKLYFSTGLEMAAEKIEWLNTRESKDKPFSMTNYKTMYNNKLLLDRFICRFGINPDSKKIKK